MLSTHTEWASAAEASTACAALARWHYVGGVPRCVAGGVLALCDGLDGVAGVLVVTHPTLNGRWRERAWPGWLDGRSPRARAAVLNAELRRIARVVVDPRARGLGVGSMLVREYLARPLTPRTETLAAMAHWCGMFSRAGMRRVEVPLCPASARLLAALREAGLGGPGGVDLCEPRVRARVARDARLAQAWRVWAGASRATRPRRGQESACGIVPGELVLIDATWARLVARPLALVHEVLGFYSKGG